MVDVLYSLSHTRTRAHTHTHTHTHIYIHTPFVRAAKERLKPTKNSGALSYKSCPNRGLVV